MRISDFDLRASMVASEPPGTLPGAHWGILCSLKLAYIGYILVSEAYILKLTYFGYIVLKSVLMFSQHTCIVYFIEYILLSVRQDRRVPFLHFHLASGSSRDSVMKSCKSLSSSPSL